MNELQGSPSTHGRPVTLKILCVAILLFSIFHLVRLIGAFNYWSLMLRLGPAVLPLYQALSGLIWFLVGTSAMVGLWFRQVWAFWLTIFAAALFTVWYWLDRVFLVGSADANTNWIFAAVLNSIILVVLFSLIALVKEDVFQGKVNL